MGAYVGQEKTVARTRKALALADVLAAAGCDAADVDSLDERGWRLASLAAKVHLPSIDTRAMVRTILEERERPTVEDAFLGFTQ